MNKGVVNENLLIKNMEKISFYSNEEYQSLTKIFQKLDSVNGIYNSENTKILQSHINKFGEDIPKIKDNRNKYVEILKRVMTKYKTLALNTSIKFQKGVK